MEKQTKVEQIKKKISETKENISKKVEIKKKKEVTKPIVTSRILFVSVLDKILLVSLLLILVGNVLSLFRGMPFNWFIYSMISLVITYLILNWFYKCAIRTMLCLTNTQVYREMYYPFFRAETSIPLEKITKVDALDFFWIFRVIIIHQYNHLPLFFWTWNNHEFKDKLDELIIKNDESVENEFKNRNIISRASLKWLKWFGIALATLIIIYYVFTFISGLFSIERKISGTYGYEDVSFKLNKNGSCDLSNLKDSDDMRITECTWEYYDETNIVEVEYDYEYKSWGSRWYDSSSSIDFEYNKDAKTLTIGNTVYTKK